MPVQGLTVGALSSILGLAGRSTVDRVAALEEENRSVRAFQKKFISLLGLEASGVLSLLPTM